MHAAIRKPKNGKGPDICGITAKMFKASGIYGANWLTDAIGHAWRSGEIPLDWKKGIILPRVALKI